MKAQSFTFDRFVRFIRRQPDRRPINMRQSHPGHLGCGCLLLHFGKEELKLPDQLSAGYNVIHSDQPKPNAVVIRRSVRCRQPNKLDCFISAAMEKDIKTYRAAKTLLDRWRRERVKTGAAHLGGSDNVGHAHDPRGKSGTGKFHF